jgi:hypothetical protein
MQLHTIATIHRFSILAMMTFLFSYGLDAQKGVVIKENVRINPQISSNASLQTEPSLTITMPFNGIAKITIYAYYVWGDPCVIMNGQEIIPGVVSQWPKWDIPLGEFTQGQSLTFTVKHYSEGDVWPGEIIPSEGVSKPDCFAGDMLAYTEDCNCGTDCRCYLYLSVDLINTTTEKYLQGDWYPSVVHGQATSLNTIYTEKCWEYTGGGSSYPLPEGTTFTFSITDGSEYGTLYAPQTGAIGSVVSGVPQDNGTCSVFFLATGTDPSEPVIATVEVQTTAAGVNTCIIPVVVHPGPGELKVTPTKSSILYGESLTFNVTKMVDGSSVPLPEGTIFFYTITSGTGAGYLSRGDESGDRIAVYFSSADFFAVEETPQDQSTPVSVWVEAYEPGGIAACSVKKKPVAGEGLQVMNQPKIQKVGLGEFQQYTMQKNTDGTITYEINNRTGCDTAQKSVHQAQSTAMQKTTHGTIYGAKIQTRPPIEKSILGTTSSEIYWYVGGASITVNKEDDDDETDCILVQPQSAILSPGETTRLLFTHIVDGSPTSYPSGTLFNVILSGPGSDYGYLKAGDLTGTTLTGAAEPISYVAPTTFEGDNIVVSFSATLNNGVPSARISHNVSDNQSLEKAVLHDIALSIKQTQTCPAGGAIVEKVCPDGTACDDLTPKLPTVTVVPQTNGSVAGTTIDCSDPKNLAGFVPINSAYYLAAFNYSETSFSVCCDGTTNRWILKILPLQLSSILDLCTGNIRAQKLKQVEPSTIFNTWDDCAKCQALHDFMAAKNTYPVVTSKEGYIITEMLRTHEEVHMSDYQEDVNIATKENFDEFKSFFAVSKETNPTITDAKQSFSGIVKILLNQILERANKMREVRRGSSGYELQTQSNARVNSVIDNYIGRLGVDVFRCSNIHCF